MDDGELIYETPDAIENALRAARLHGTLTVKVFGQRVEDEVLVLMAYRSLVR